VPLETATYIRDLVAANPPVTDYVSQGDDHLRMIKSALQNTFSTLCGPQLPTVGGTANAITLTYPTAPSSNLPGEVIAFAPTAVNTGPVTIAVNGNAAIGLLYQGQQLVGGELQAGTMYTAIVGPGGSFFNLISPISAVANGSSFGGFRNVLINGNFERAQRIGETANNNVAVAASTNAYQFDRWFFGTQVGQAGTVFYGTGGLPIGNISVGNYFRNSGQTGVGPIAIAQALDVDQINHIQGKYVTGTVRFATGANFSATSVQVLLAVGTGAPAKRGLGYPGETIILNGSLSTTVSMGWTTASFVSAVPVPANATQGQFWLGWSPIGTAGTSDSLLTANMQLEVGNQFTGFEYRPAAVEWQMCQRYYCKTFNAATQPAQSVSAGALAWAQQGAAGVATNQVAWRYPVQMRATPTITTYNPGAANAQIRNNSFATDFAATTAANFSDSGATIFGTPPAGSAAGNSVSVHLTAEAEI